MAHAGEINLQLAMNDASISQYTEYPGQLLKKRLKAANVKGLSISSEVVFDDSFSMKAGVDSVLKRAAKSGTELIAIQTRARKGLNRFVLGSFAETLIHRQTSTSASIDGIRAFHAGPLTCPFICSAAFGPDQPSALARTTMVK